MRRRSTPMARATGARATLLLAVICALALLIPPNASAHARLLSSLPARGARLTVAPREIRLTFSERAELAVTRVELVGPDSIPVLLAPPHFAADSQRVVVAEIRGGLQPGRYRVAWRMASADGHPITGTFTFTVDSAAAGLAAPVVAVTPAADSSPAVPVVAAESVTATRAAPRAATRAGFDAGSPLYVAVRWLTYGALTVVLGTVAFALLVLWLVRYAQGSTGSAVVDVARQRAARIGASAAGVLALAAVARLIAQSRAMNAGGDGGAEHVGTWAMLTGTVWGWGWLLQGGATLAALAGFALAARRKSG
ncbi:MAG: copper resistance CopC family protein, partial [Gemmatimonadaceae bacterium]